MDDFDYESACRWFEGLDSRGIRPGLGSITELLARLGDPQDSFKSIHVAGSDGKGSTCAFIYSILISSGVRTGSFSSPYIECMREMLSVDGCMISEGEFTMLAQEVVPVVDCMCGEGIECTFFEVMTAMAFLWFQKKGAEYAVVEAGMGGRGDATNVIVPVVSVITNISREHTQYLGYTIREIAFQKAGIVKRGVPVVTSAKRDALEVVREAAASSGSGLAVVEPAEVSELSEAGSVLTYRGMEFRPGIPGSYQSENMAVAVEAVMLLGDHRIAPHLQEGIASARCPGRMQKMEGLPLVVDATHTKAGMEILCRDVERIYGRVVSVFGVLGDKDVAGMCQHLARISDRIIVAPPDSDRAMDSAEIRRVVGMCADESSTADSVSEALDEAMELSEGKIILVTGSFRMVEGAYRWLRARSAKYSI